MILGIDFGATTTDAVLLSGKKIVKKASTGKISTAGKLNTFLKKNGFKSFSISTVAVTGGKSRFFKSKVLGLKPKHVNEINAIAFGAAFLAKTKRCLAVSFGTGTCLVLFEKGKAKHVIGTGIGGGTITGLSKLLVKETGPDALVRMAKKGNIHNVDLSVKEVIGSGIGLLEGSATASNFARAKGSRADLAAAVQNLAAESVAVLAIATSRQCNCKKIVFTGRTLSFPIIQKRLAAAAKCFGAKFFFPKNKEFATAIGAVFAFENAS